MANHHRWASDIKETQGAGPNYPMIGDTDLKVSKLYGMLPAELDGTCDGRTAADNMTVRNGAEAVPAARAATARVVSARSSRFKVKGWWK